MEDQNSFFFFFFGTTNHHFEAIRLGSSFSICALSGTTTSVAALDYVNHEDIRLTFCYETQFID